MTIKGMAGRRIEFNRPRLGKHEETTVTKSPKQQEAMVEISEIQMNEITFNVLGESPLIMNRFNQKAWQELLFPSRSKNRAERETSMKHDPIKEFRGAVYRCRDDKSPTLIHMPNGSFHGALASAALDIPGATKSKIERLTRVINPTVELFGVPHIFCAMVRNSDMARTPDVRTRPIFPQWACRVTVRYVKSLLTERTICNLFGAAGLIIGVGDWRGEKGGPYGAWKLVGDEDREFKQVLKQGRAAQQVALDNPIFYDQDTEELLVWFDAEVVRREREGAVESRGKKPAGKRNGKRPPSPVFVEDRDGNLLSQEA